MINERIEQLELLVSRLEKAGMSAAHHRSLAEAIQDAKKSKIGQLCNDYEGSMAHKESMAYASPQFKEFQKGAIAQKEKFYAAQYYYDNLKIQIEVIRSILSTIKEELKKL